MSIVIKVPPEQLTFDFVTQQAPCKTCSFYMSDLDGDGYSRCMKAFSRLSSTVIKDCSDNGWYKKKDE